MTTESKLNDELTNVQASLEKTLPLKNGKVMRAVGGTRVTILDVITKYTDENGKIPKGRTSEIMRDLQRVEGELYRNLRYELNVVVRDTASFSTVAIAAALVAILGVSALAEFAGIVGDIGSSAAQVFNALVGSDYLEFIGSVRQSVFNRKGPDGKQLNDRLQSLSKELYADLSATLRNSIANSEGTADIQRKVRQRFEGVKNRIKTIVETEVMYAHRQTIAWTAERSGIASGLKIVDYPHGKPSEHRRHKCYKYAHADDHGMGTGVYPVTILKIRNPHPRCRATLHMVLAGKLQ